VDPHQLDADPDPACQFDVDLDADSDPTCPFNVDVDPDPAFHFDAVKSNQIELSRSGTWSQKG
jgi:hypothetical protein